MLCAKCNNDNPADASFCEECGAKLELACPACKTLASPGARFCKKCGTALAATRPDSPPASYSESPIRVIGAAGSASEAIDGERKTVTALFADIKGSTELMEDLDPEEARAIIDPALKLMIDAVQSLRRLCRAIDRRRHLRAVRRAGRARGPSAARALCRAADAGGAETLLGESCARPGTCRSKAVSASTPAKSWCVRSRPAPARPNTRRSGIRPTSPRGCRPLAPIGSIAVSETTRKLCEGYFALKPLGPTKVKGVSEPVNVYEVTGLGPLRTRLQRAAGRGLTKFVGREREMEALKHAAEQAKSGHGQIVAAMAEPGVGKSRLFFEFKATSQSGWMVLETFSVSHGKASALSAGDRSVA